MDVEAGREEDCMSVSTMRRGAVEGSEQRATEPKIHKFILGIFRFCSLIQLDACTAGHWLSSKPLVACCSPLDPLSSEPDSGLTSGWLNKRGYRRATQSRPLPPITPPWHPSHTQQTVHLLLIVPPKYPLLTDYFPQQ